MRTMAQSLILIVALLVSATAAFAQTRTRDAATKKNAYVVAAQGDSIAKIAARNNIAAADLASANQLPLNAKLRWGQRLLLPVAKAGSEAGALNETNGEV